MSTVGYTEKVISSDLLKKHNCVPGLCFEVTSISLNKTLHLCAAPDLQRGCWDGWWYRNYGCSPHSVHNKST